MDSGSYKDKEIRALKPFFFYYQKYLKMKNKFLLFLGLVFLTSNVMADSIIINHPTDNLYSDDLTQDFNITVIGSNASYTCSILAKTCGGGYNYFVTEEVINNNTPTVKTGSAMKYKDYIWKAVCNGSHVTTTSAERNLYLGTSKYRAMDSFGKFVNDFINFMPKIITLIIFGVIIGLVIYVSTWIKGVIKR
jgi:hypothetical protein